MSPETILLLKDFGFPVLVSAALAYFILYLMNSHKEERMIDRAERKEIATRAFDSNEKLADALHKLEARLREQK